MLPTEPNTPPNSRVWRVLHFPLMLLFVGFVFVFGGQIVASMLAKLSPPLKGTPISVLQASAFAALIAGAYVAFVRLIERRPVVEFGHAGWARELAAGLLGGTLLFSIVIGIIAALGGYRVIGTGSVAAIYPAAAMAILSGVVEEIVLRGLFFGCSSGCWGAGSRSLCRQRCSARCILGTPMRRSPPRSRSRWKRG